MITGRRSTLTGRIVYDRKKHPWKWSDMVRAIERVDFLRPINIETNLEEVRQWGSLLYCWDWLNQIIKLQYPFAVMQQQHMVTYLEETRSRFPRWYQSYGARVAKLYKEESLRLLIDKLRIFLNVLPK